MNFFIVAVIILHWSEALATPPSLIKGPEPMNAAIGV